MEIFLQILKSRPLSSHLLYSVLARDEILELTVNVSGLPDDGIVYTNLKYFEKDVDGMNAMIVSLG